MSDILRFPYKCSIVVFLAISLSSTTYCSDLKDNVKAILKSPGHDSAEANAQNDIWQQHAEAMRALMVDVFPALTDLLTDYDYGYPAAETMLRFDRRRALPLILKSAPNADRNVQNLGFNEFMSNYFGASHDSSCAALAHAAAIAVLENEYSPRDTEEAALYVIGLVGSSNDFPRLERHYAQSYIGVHAASEAALARLGSKQHLDNIRAKLRRPLPRHLNFISGEEIQSWRREAAFVGDRELVPLVCRHLDDPNVTDGGDSFMAPSIVAAAALEAMAQGKFPVSGWGSPAKWRVACHGN